MPTVDSTKPTTFPAKKEFVRARFASAPDGPRLRWTGMNFSMAGKCRGKYVPRGSLDGMHPQRTPRAKGRIRTVAKATGGFNWSCVVFPAQLSETQTGCSV